MFRTVRTLCVLLACFFVATTQTGCEPCEDPSQLWCPDQW